MLTAPKRLTSITLRQPVSFCVPFNTVPEYSAPPEAMPALLNRNVTRWRSKCASIRSAAATHASHEDTSQRIVRTAVAPAEAIASAAVLIDASFVSRIATAMCAAAHRFAASRPNPLAPPVITATPFASRSCSTVVIFSRPGSSRLGRALPQHGQWVSQGRLVMRFHAQRSSCGSD